MTILVEALFFIVISRSYSEGCGFNSYYRSSSFLRFNSWPIMLPPYCTTWNKGVQLLSILKPWPIGEMSFMSENNGITVRQTVAHTVQLWPHGLGTPCGSCLLRRKAHNPFCLSQAAAIVALALNDTTTTGSHWGVNNTRRGLNKYTSYITLQ